MRVLIVEDDSNIAASIVRALTESKIVASVIGNGLEASSILERARRYESKFDAVILDLTIPGMDGIDVLRKMRSANDRTPVLVLSARSSLADKVAGLNLGADDYLSKPFESSELVARLRVITRRVENTAEVKRKLGNLTFDQTTAVFQVDGEPLPLTPKSSAVLEALFKRQGASVPKEFFMSMGVEGMSIEALNLHISRIRRTLREMHCNVTIKTLHSIGYTLIASEPEDPV